GGRRGHPLRRRPGRAIVTTCKNIRLAVAEPLPNQPQIPIRISRELMIDVGLRVAREPLDRRPCGTFETPTIEVPVALHLRRPHHPRTPFLVAAHLGEKDVAWRGQDLVRRLPRRPVEAARENFVRALVLQRTTEADPCGPYFAIRPAEHSREIVFVFGGGKHLRRGYAVDDDAAAE